MSYPVVSRDWYLPRTPWCASLRIWVQAAAAALSVGLCCAAPSNDSIKSAQGIAGRSGAVTCAMHDATGESGDPILPTLPDAVSVWFRYHAFARGPLTLSLRGAPAESRIVLFQQRNFPLAFGSILSLGLAPAQTVTFPTTLSTTYVIAVLSPRSAGTDFTLEWSQAVPADNDIDLAIAPESIRPQVQIREYKAADEAEVVDKCAKVGVRRLLAVDFDVYNMGKEDLVLGEDYMSPWSAYSTAEMWWRFIGFWRIEMRNAQGQIVAFVEPPMIPSFSGTRRWNPQGSSVKRFNFDHQGLRGGWMQKVQSYWACQFIDITDIPPGDYSVDVVVDPWNRIPETREDNNRVTFPVTVTPMCQGTPANDNRQNAIELQGAVATVVTRNECATAEPGERRHFRASPPSRSIWFRWTAPYTGDVSVSTQGSSFDTVLEVQGPATNGVNGPSIASDDDIQEFDQASYLIFSAVEGTTYWIVVDGLNQGDGATAGTVVLSINPAGNNNFSKAERLSGVSGERCASTYWADVEQGEPQHDGDEDGHSVWYRWVAPYSGAVSFDVTSTEFTPVLDGYQGSDLTSLVPVPPADDDSAEGTAGHLRFAAVGGQTYYFAVDGEGLSKGTFHLQWRMDPALAPPSFVVNRRRSGVIRVTVTAQDGQNFQIMRSSNMIDWKPVGHMQMVGAITSWSDPEGPTLGAAFYRIVPK